MRLDDAIILRHSVRQYLDKPIDEEIKSQISEFIEKINEDSGLNVQAVWDEPTAFTGLLASYGKFTNVKNYIAMVGKNDGYLDEKVGYYGEKIVIYAQQLGLNTCWVGLTYKKIRGAYKVRAGEKIRLVISIGYGENKGKEHVGKEVDRVCELLYTPNWFRRGMNFALLAPTAMNQQKFFFTCSDNVVSAVAGAGFYTKVDLGIVKYHFEVGAGKSNFEWSKNTLDVSKLPKPIVIIKKPIKEVAEDNTETEEKGAKVETAILETEPTAVEETIETKAEMEIKTEVKKTNTKKVAENEVEAKAVEKAEAPTVETAKTEKEKTEEVKPEEVKTEAEKVETPTLETAETEKEKIEEVKPEEVKTEAEKVETPTVETSETETTKNEETESPKTEAKKTKTVKK